MNMLQFESLYTISMNFCECIESMYMVSVWISIQHPHSFLVNLFTVSLCFQWALLICIYIHELRCRISLHCALFLQYLHDFSVKWTSLKFRFDLSMVTWISLQLKPDLPMASLWISSQYKTWSFNGLSVKRLNRLTLISSYLSYLFLIDWLQAPEPKAKAPKPKLRTEDGIFGTSGGIGFTKQNELFVGRVAMIGFAVSYAKSSSLWLYNHGVCGFNLYKKKGYVWLRL